MDEVIGIDHGFGYVKTAKHVFLSGVDEFASEPPLLQNVIEYNGKYYVIGEHRKPYSPHKTETLEYYILTLAAVAKELISRRRSTQNSSVVLAAGLPLEYYGSQKEEFKKYLDAKKEVTFRFDGKMFNISIKNAVIFPQGYAVVADKINRSFGSKTLVDIGTGTVDILPIINCKPQLSRCESLPLGVLNCIELIQKQFRQKYNLQIEEYLIQDLLQKKQVPISKEYVTLAQNTIQQYTDKVLKELEQKGIIMGMTPVIFCGGGATILKNYAKYDRTTVEFVTDIHANAAGYEYLYQGIK